MVIQRAPCPTISICYPKMEDGKWLNFPTLSSSRSSPRFSLLDIKPGWAHKILIEQAEWKVALLFYTVISALTLVYQFWIELPQCEWFGGCLLSFSEGIVLAVIWPLYWPLYFGWL